MNVATLLVALLWWSDAAAPFPDAARTLLSPSLPNVGGALAAVAVLALLVVPGGRPPRVTGPGRRE